MERRRWNHVGWETGREKEMVMGEGEKKKMSVGKKEVEEEAEKMTEHRWRPSAGTNLT